MKPVWVACALVASLVLAGLVVPGSAAAQAGRASQVVLIDGSVVRGEIVTYEPGVRVVLRQGDGREREIPADQIQSADFDLMPMPAARPSAWLGDPEAGVPEAERPPERARRPVRFGVQLTGAGELYDDRFVPPGGYGDLGLVLEIRPVWRFHLRASFSVWTDGRQPESEPLGATFHPGLIGARGRLLAGLDLPYRLAVRGGAEVGFVFFSIAGQGDVVLPVGGGVLEVGWRAIFGFEVALVLGVVARTGRVTSGLGTAEDHTAVGARLGLHVEYLF